MVLYFSLDTGNAIVESEILNYLNSGYPIGSINSDKNGTLLKTCDPNDGGRCKQIHIEKIIKNVPEAHHELCENFDRMKYNAGHGAGSFTENIKRCPSCEFFYDAHIFVKSYCKECHSKYTKTKEYREAQNKRIRERRAQNDDVRLKDAEYQREYYKNMSEEKREKLRAKKNEYARNRYKTDTNYRENLREYNREYAKKRRENEK